MCGDDFPASNISVDHKQPVVDPKEGFVSWDVFINRLFCDKDNLQVLCKEDHLAKTKKEKDESKKRRQS